MAPPLATGQSSPGRNHNHLFYRLNSCKYLICSSCSVAIWSRLCIPQRHHFIKGYFTLLALTTSIPRTMFSPSTCWQYDTKLTIYSHFPWKQAQNPPIPLWCPNLGSNHSLWNQYSLLIISVSQFSKKER